MGGVAVIVIVWGDGGLGTGRAWCEPGVAAVPTRLDEVGSRIGVAVVGDDPNYGF